MRKLLAVGLVTLTLAGCETCQAPANVNAGIGVGDSGVSTGLSVGTNCGPGYISIGTGNAFGLGF